MPSSIGFVLISASGLWEQKVRHKRLYRIYIAFNTLMMYSTLITLVVPLILQSGSTEDFVETLYIFICGLNALIKGMNVLMMRSRFENLAKMLLETGYVPSNQAEIRIRSNLCKIQRFVVIAGFLVAEGSAITTGMSALFNSKGPFKLSVDAWYPYEINSSLTFWISFIHQALGIIILAAWNSANDLLATGLMLEICAQIQIMSSRLKNLPVMVKSPKMRKVMKGEIKRFEMNFIKQTVRHHLFIFELTEKFKSTFAINIFSQYCVNSFLLCLAIYKLTVRIPNLAQVIAICNFLLAILIELSIYCWFSNEILVKSSKINETIYKGNWTDLQISTLKAILIVMAKAKKPIQITCGPFIRLSNDTFTTLLMFSYSAFNVLRQSSSK